MDLCVQGLCGLSIFLFGKYIWIWQSLAEETNSSLRIFSSTEKYIRNECWICVFSPFAYFVLFTFTVVFDKWWIHDQVASSHTCTHANGRKIYVVTAKFAHLAHLCILFYNYFYCCFWQSDGYMTLLVICTCASVITNWPWVLVFHHATHNNLNHKYVLQRVEIHNSQDRSCIQSPIIVLHLTT